MKAHWELVHTEAGHHLRLVRDDGEILLWSQVYDDPEAAMDDHKAARFTFMRGISFAMPTEVWE